MKRIIAFLMVGVVIIGCGKSVNISNDSKTTKDVEETVADIKGEDEQLVSATTTPDKNLTPAPATDKTSFYGEWSIVSSTGKGYISSASYDEKDYVGIRISIKENEMIIKYKKKNKTITNPNYNKRVISEKKLYKEDGVLKRNLEIDDNSDIVKVQVYKGKKEWEEFGSCFFVKDDEHLIFDGPMYFLAERQQD